MGTGNDHPVNLNTNPAFVSKGMKPASAKGMKPANAKEMKPANAKGMLPANAKEMVHGKAKEVVPGRAKGMLPAKSKGMLPAKTKEMLPENNPISAEQEAVDDFEGQNIPDSRPERDPEVFQGIKPGIRPAPNANITK